MLKTGREILNSNRVFLLHFQAKFYEIAWNSTWRSRILPWSSSSYGLSIQFFKKMLTRIFIWEAVAGSTVEGTLNRCCNFARSWEGAMQLVYVIKKMSTNSRSEENKRKFENWPNFKNDRISTTKSIIFMSLKFENKHINIENKVDWLLTLYFEIRWLNFIIKFFYFVYEFQGSKMKMKISFTYVSHVLKIKFPPVCSTLQTRLASHRHYTISFLWFSVLPIYSHRKNYKVRGSTFGFFGDLSAFGDDENCVVWNVLRSKAVAHVQLEIWQKCQRNSVEWRT